MSKQEFSLADRFDLTKPQVLLNGTQALVRNLTAAEIVALVAHSVVGQDWLSAIHRSEATTSVDRISATATASSAATQAGRRPTPCR